MVRVIHVLRQIVNTNANWTMTKLSVCALVDTSSIRTEDHASTKTNALTTMETASTYATTTLVLILVLAIQATI